MEIITLTTDFGLTDGYPASMKGVIFAINPDVKLIDISHSILPQNINQGAFILYSVLPYYPDAIHIAVIDPGVGTDRAGLIIKCNTGVLVGPDNGVLIPIANKLSIESVYKIKNSKFTKEKISNTFHGRDIFAPTAAHISKGIPMEDLGKPIDDYVDLDLFKIEKIERGFIVQILNIDNFGNIITNLSEEQLKREIEIDSSLKIKIKDNISGEIKQELKLPFKKTYEEVPKGELICLISSSGFLEIGANQSNASKILKIQFNDLIIIEY